MSLLIDLWRAFRLRPEQLSVPMTERRPALRVVEPDLRAERDRWRRRALDVEQAARALLANLAEHDEVRYGDPVAGHLYDALARHDATGDLEMYR